MHGRTIIVQTKLQVSAIVRSAPMLASQGWLDTASELNEASVVSSLKIAEASPSAGCRRTAAMRSARAYSLAQHSLTGAFSAAAKRG